MYSEKFRSLILEGLSNAQIPQEILYLQKGAENYYQAYGQGKTLSQTSKESFSHSKLDYLAFVEYILIETKLQKPKINLISLGCGNGFQEKELLRTLVKSGYTIFYFGVDNSEAMLQLAKENLNEIDITKNFICADFCLEQEKIKESLESFFVPTSINLFMLMGKTISNFDPSSLLFALHKLLTTSYRKNNFLWLELFGRQTDNLSIQHKKVSFSVLDALQKRYSAYLKSAFMQKFYLNPLQELGINTDKGKLVLSEREEEKYHTKVFEIAFEFEKKESVIIFGKEFNFMPSQKLLLYPIRNFYLPTFEKLLEEHYFLVAEKEENMYDDEIIEVQFMLQAKYQND